MDSNLTVTLIQSSLFWQNKYDNLVMFADKIASIKEKTDLIILPEMFTTGFSMEVEKLAEPIEDSAAIQWMQEQSAKTGAVITGSLILKEGSQYYNRLIWMHPDGTYEHYDKRHLFRMAEEERHFSGGDFRLITELKGWKICPLICYDLRFPIWSRNRNQEYDLLIYVANWPNRRSSAWDNLLQARAIENLSYVVGVNRVGEDGNEISYCGNSTVLNYLGDHLYFKHDKPDVHTITLDKTKMQEFRSKFPAYLDADKFEILS